MRIPQGADHQGRAPYVGAEDIGRRCPSLGRLQDQGLMVISHSQPERLVTHEVSRHVACTYSVHAHLLTG